VISSLLSTRQCKIPGTATARPATISLHHPCLQGYHSSMKQVKSKFIAVVALLLFVGQVAASPLLTCAEMSHMSPEPDCHEVASVASDMTHSMDSHAGHPMGEPKSPVSDHGTSHGDSPLCELCAGCSTASGFHSGSAQTLLRFPNQASGYDSSLIHILRTNPFRPPIAA
jgi:hypothetical protein